jgi:hypothetical protein
VRSESSGKWGGEAGVSLRVCRRPKKDSYSRKSTTCSVSYWMTRGWLGGVAAPFMDEDERATGSSPFMP